MDKLILRFSREVPGGGPTADDEAMREGLRALSARLADVLRPHWPLIGATYVPVEVRWPDEGAGTYVEVMTEGGVELHALGEAAGEIRRCYLDALDALIAVAAEDEPASVAELERLRSVIATLA